MDERRDEPAGGNERSDKPIAVDEVPAAEKAAPSDDAQQERAEVREKLPAADESPEPPEVDPGADDRTRPNPGRPY